MNSERQARKRHNTIAFWLSDEEKKIVEAKITVAGVEKGEYYRKAILGETVQIVGGHYKSNRLAMVLEKINENIERGDDYDGEELKQILKELLELMKQ